MKNEQWYNILTHLATDSHDSSCVSSMLLLGEPGTGKTRFAMKLAEYWNAEMEFYQCHEGTTEDQLLYTYNAALLADVISARGTTDVDQALVHGCIVKALKLSQKDKVVLVIDEIDKAHPSVDPFLLNFLQNCFITDPVLGRVDGNRENLIVVLTSNEQRQLNDALPRRVINYRMSFPNPNEMKERIISNVGKDAIDDFGVDRLNFLVDLCYWYRSQKPKKLLVQNELERIIEVSRFCCNIPDSGFDKALPYLISYHDSDIKILDTHSGGGIKYISSMLYRCSM